MHSILLCDIFSLFDIACLNTYIMSGTPWDNFISMIRINHKMHIYERCILRIYLGNSANTYAQWIHQLIYIDIAQLDMGFMGSIFASWYSHSTKYFKQNLRSPVESLCDKYEWDADTVRIKIYERIKHNITTDLNGFWKKCNVWPNIYYDAIWGGLTYLELTFPKDVGGLESHMIDVVWNARRWCHLQINPELSEKQSRMDSEMIMAV